MEPSMGSIPKDIEGTFFRNGPAKFKVRTGRDASIVSGEKHSPPSSQALKRSLSHIVPGGRIVGPVVV